MKKLIFGDFMMKGVSTSLLDTVAISMCICYAKPPVMSPNVQKCQKYPHTLSLHNNTFPKIYNLLWFWKSDFQVHFDAKQPVMSPNVQKCHKYPHTLSLHNNTFPKIYNLLWFWKSDFQVHFDQKSGDRRPKLDTKCPKVSKIPQYLNST